MASPGEQRLAEGIREYIVQEDMELDDESGPLRPSGGPTAGNERLGADLPGLLFIKDARRDGSEGRTAMLRPAVDEFDQGDQVSEEVRYVQRLHVLLHVRHRILQRSGVIPLVGNGIVRIGELVAELAGNGERTQVVDGKIAHPLAE